jgi:hypothetical protein
MKSMKKVTDYTGSEKSNMAASKPEVAISQLVSQIETRF